MKAAHRRTAATSAFLAAAGGLGVAASSQRWWPSCRPGDFDTDACLTLQDHAYDYTVPVDPWLPVGTAAQLQGAGMLALAAAVALLPRLLAGRPLGRGLRATTALVVASIAALGAITLLSGVAGASLMFPGAAAPFGVWVLGLPALVVAAAARSVVEPPGAWVSRFAVAGCLVASNPLAEVFLAPALLGYASYDSTPWAEAVTSSFLVVAAIAVWPAAAAGSPRTWTAAAASEGVSTSVERP